MSLPIKVKPYVVEPVPGGVLPLVARVSYQGRWIDLEDPDNGFELHDTAFAQATSDFHSNDVQSPYVVGTYSTGVQRNDITEVVAVWVFGSTTYGVRSRRQLLMDAFGQRNYQMFVRIEDSAEMWNCRFATLARDTKKDYLHGRRELLTFQVPRKPDARPVLASMDEA